MNKKQTFIIIVSLIVLFGIVFLAYKYIKTDESFEKNAMTTDSTVAYVIDEDGKLVVDPDSGKPYIYVVDEDGNKVKDEDGNYITVVSGESTPAEDAKEAGDTSEGDGDKTFPTVPIEDPGTEGTSEGESSEATETSPATNPSGDVIGEITLPS